MKAIFALLLVAVLLAAGCVSQPVDTGTGEPSGTPAETDTLSEVDTGISAIDELGSDLDISDMETVESGLEDLNW